MAQLVKRYTIADDCYEIYKFTDAVIKVQGYYIRLNGKPDGFGVYSTVEDCKRAILERVDSNGE